MCRLRQKESISRQRVCLLAYLMTLFSAQNGETNKCDRLWNVWKEAVMAGFGNYPMICWEQLRGTMEAIVIHDQWPKNTIGTSLLSVERWLTCYILWQFIWLQKIYLLMISFWVRKSNKRILSFG
jgi:hypothetical protein